MNALSESISNHLNMKTSGALLLTGDWGSGKTYHIKKYIFPLIEETTEFTPIIISLYGETDKQNIANKVLFAFFDKKGKNVNLSTGTIAKNIKNLSEGIPILKKYVDIDKLIVGTGENAFRFLPHDKLLICFDDIERMSDKIKIDDFLGIVNDLVENKGCKVLLIANENEIKDEISFKEKTVEKTIYFLPNIGDILDSITNEYPDSNFKSYLRNNKDFIIKTLTATLDDEKKNVELRKAFSNIRTLKFALEHFKFPFNLLANSPEIDETLAIQLKNIWVFTLSISIEFRKPKNISFTERKKLDSQTTTFSDLDFSNFKLLSTTTEIDEKVENEWSYSKNFKKLYFSRLSESYIFYQELYDLITSGKAIYEQSFLDNVEQSFKVKEGRINPAHQILNTFLHSSYWSYTNTDFKGVLNNLLIYCEKGELEDIVSYLNAGFYLLHFNELFGKKKDEIVEKIKLGLDIFLPKIKLNYYISQFEMVQGNFNETNLQILIKYIEDKFAIIEAQNAINEAKELESMFTSDINSFVKGFLPENSGIRTSDKPLFHKFNKTTVHNSLKVWKSDEIINVASLLKTRYIDTSFIKRLTDEIAFLENLESGISSINFFEKTLSNYLLQSHLLPRVIECKKQLQSYKDGELPGQ